MYTSCLPWLLPLERVCKHGPIEVRYSGKNRHSSVSDLQPYTTYKLRVVSYNSVGSTPSEWITFTTEKEGEFLQTKIRICIWFPSLLGELCFLSQLLRAVPEIPR